MGVFAVKSLSVRLVAISIVSLGLIFGAAIWMIVAQVSGAIDAQTDQLQAETTERVALTAEKDFAVAGAAAKNMVDTLAALKAQGVTDRAIFDAVIRKALEENKVLLGAWSGWEPNALDGRDADFVNSAGSDASGRYVPYWNRASGSVALEPLVDYDKAGAGDYYQLPKSLGRPVAIEPYLYKISGKDVLMMSFGLPIMVNGAYQGTGGVDLGLSDLSARISEIHPFETGFVEVVSQSGILASSRDVAELGKSLPADDPRLAAVKQALETNGVVSLPITRDGVAMQAVAVPFQVGVTQDRWVALSQVPIATLNATINRAQMTVLGLGALCLLVAAALLYGLTRFLVAQPLNQLKDVMGLLAGGKNDVTISGIQRKDEVGAMARALEVFRNAAIEKQRIEAEAAADRGVAEQERAAADAARRQRAAEKAEEEARTAKAVTALSTGLQRLSEGDLTVSITEPFEGGADSIRQAFNRTVENFSSVMGQLKQTSSQLKTATSEILSGANDLSERTTRQAATIEETSAAMEQLSSTVLTTAERAADASQNAGTVTKAAEEGGAVMGRANEAMLRIEQSSAKISNIIGLIDDIAFQTNLLALNASVEAARAGEAGKGFAVVAVEVRRLAQSAAEASAEVKALIEQSANEVNSGSRLVADAARTLETMRDAVRRNRELLDAIARESKEQSSAIAEVVTAVRQMDEMTQHNAALVEETNAAIEQTETQAIELDQIVERFKIAGAAVGGNRASAAPARQGTLKALGARLFGSERKRA